MTHGETIYALINQLEHGEEIDKVVRKIFRAPERMSRKDASAYYGKKIKKHFENTRQIKNFDNQDDYFGYYEALKLRDKILGE